METGFSQLITNKISREGLVNGHRLLLHNGFWFKLIETDLLSYFGFKFTENQFKIPENPVPITGNEARS